HEVPLGPALGNDETDTAAGQSREPLAEQVALGHLLRQQELRRRRDVLAVELANERRQDLAVVGARGPIEEERLLSDQAALAHEEELHVAHRRRVALASLPSGAGCIAPVDEVLDAGTLELPVDPDRARPQWKELARQPERLPHGGGRVERAEVGGAILVNA